jgi:hypothetical protein
MIDYGLPERDRSMCNKVRNRLLAEELAYNSEELVSVHISLVSQLNSDKKKSL